MYQQSNDGVQAEAADIASALRSLEPNKRHRNNQLFSLIYPTITEMLKQNVTQKAILKMLADKGLKLHPSRFKELMKAEEMAGANGLADSGEAEQ